MQDFLLKIRYQVRIPGLKNQVNQPRSMTYLVCRQKSYLAAKNRLFMHRKEMELATRHIIVKDTVQVYNLTIS